MKNLITSILILISVLGFSQQRYDLFIDQKNCSKFEGRENELSRVCQIYYVHKIDSVSFTIFNHYLRFEFVGDTVQSPESGPITGRCIVSFCGHYEGTFVATIHVLELNWYIIKFVLPTESASFYYFYRRWDFLEKSWPEDSPEIRTQSRVPTTVGNSK